MLSRQTERDLRRILAGRNVQAALMSYLKSHARPAKVSSRKAEKAKRRAEKNAETARIREACFKRSGGFCECGCGGLLYMFGWSFGAAEMDHVLGGSGRRVQQQSEATCWILTPLCHRDKTENRPSAAYWTYKFNAHARRHGYPEIHKIEHAPVSRKVGP